MKAIILKENVLTEDTLFLSDDKKVFKGGFVAILKYYTFANCWSDDEHVLKFKSIESLKKTLHKMYKDLDIEL